MAELPELTKPTLRGMVNLKEALDQEDDMLLNLKIWQSHEDFFNHLYNSRDLIAAAVAQHMSASQPPICRLSGPEKWMSGSYNVCIPAELSYGRYQRLIVRIPLPHKVGEFNFPGNTDEKLSVEAATYAFIEDNCPRVPIPRLFGYALSNGERVSVWNLYK